MASSSFPCSIEQGFNFQKDAQLMVGHINSLKIGEKEFAKDLSVEDPTKITEDESTVKVVGVLSNIYWEGGYADSIQLSCQISVTNKQDAVVLQHTNLSNTNVEFSFTVYDYDPVKKTFYKGYHANDTDLKGLVEKNGDDLAINVDIVQGSEVASPINYGLYLGVMPQETEQDIHYGVSVDGKFVKKWGITVEA